MILRICSNCLISCLTAWTLVPDPRAIRSRRDPLINSGWRLSWGVIDRMIAVGRLGLLDQRHHIAHPEDPLRHPVGVETLELIELLARRGEHDRLAGDRFHRQRGAAAGIAVELGHHYAVEVHDLRKLLGD